MLNASLRTWSSYIIFSSYSITIIFGQCISGCPSDNPFIFTERTHREEHLTIHLYADAVQRNPTAHYIIISSLNCSWTVDVSPELFPRKTSLIFCLPVSNNPRFASIYVSYSFTVGLALSVLLCDWDQWFKRTLNCLHLGKIINGWDAVIRTTTTRSACSITQAWNSGAVLYPPCVLLRHYENPLQAQITQPLRTGLASANLFACADHMVLHIIEFFS